MTLHLHPTYLMTLFLSIEISQASVRSFVQYMLLVLKSVSTNI
jgi:hypothetical protein